jgi:hypothetical protein
VSTYDLTLSSRVKLARSNAVRADIDTSAMNGKIKFYSAPRPSGGEPATGTLLAVVSLSQPCGTVDASGLHLTPLTSGQAVASGEVAWARVTDGDDIYVMDGSVLAETDPDAALAPFIVDIVQVYAGGYVNLLSATLLEGG